jgi:hypothetical protein
MIYGECLRTGHAHNLTRPARRSLLDASCWLDANSHNLLHFLRTQAASSKVIVFVRTGVIVNYFSAIFTPAIGTDRPIFPLHGHMKQEDRESSLGDLRIVFNTVLIAMDVATHGTQLSDHFCKLFRHDCHFNGNRRWSERIDELWLRTMS